MKALRRFREPRRPQRRITLVALLLAAAVLSGVGCGDDEDASQSGEGGDVATLNMGTQAWIGYGPWWIADEKGFDIDNGVDINLTNFRADTEMNAAYAAGRIDAENAANYTVLDFIAQDVPLELVLLEDVSLSADATLAGPEVESLEDLRGKSIASEQVGFGNVMLEYTLSQAGLTSEDVEVVDVPAADTGTALIAGRVDAATTYEPYITEALKDPDVKILYDAGEKPGLISDLLAVDPEYAADNPEAVTAALRAWNDAIEFYRTDTKEAQGIIAKNVGAEPADLATAFEGVELYDLEQSQADLEGDFPGLTTELVGILQECCDYPAEPNIESLINTSYAADALQE